MKGTLFPIVNQSVLVCRNWRLSKVEVVHSLSVVHSLWKSESRLERVHFETHTQDEDSHKMDHTTRLALDDPK